MSSLACACGHAQCLRIALTGPTLTTQSLARAAGSWFAWMNDQPFVFGSSSLGGLFRLAIFREKCRPVLTQINPSPGSRLDVCSWHKCDAPRCPLRRYRGISGWADLLFLNRG